MATKVTKSYLDAAITELTGTFKSLLAESIDEIKNTIIQNLKICNEKLQARVESLEEEILALREANVDLERRTEVALQHGRLEQVVISGIPPVVEHTDLEDMAVNILNEIKDHKVTPRDVAACHRLGKKNDTILRFVNRKDADDCFENKSKLKNITRESYGLEPGANIYIRENLSPYMSKLAFFCRVLKRKTLVDKVTTYKGVVKITRTVRGHPVKDVIAHKSDLEEIFDNLDELLK